MTPSVFLRIIDGRLFLWNYVSHEQFEIDFDHLRRLSQNPGLHRLLAAFKARTGYGVLCNTSLNFNGAGFINRTSDLVAYAEQAGLDGFVIEGALFQRDTSPMHAGGSQ